MEHMKKPICKQKSLKILIVCNEFLIGKIIEIRGFEHNFGMFHIYDTKFNSIMNLIECTNIKGFLSNDTVYCNWTAHFTL